MPNAAIEGLINQYITGNRESVKSILTLNFRTNTWASVTFPKQTGALQVKIQKSIDGGNTWTDADTDTLTAASESADIRNLSPYVSYKFRLLLNGNFSGDILSISAMEIPPASTTTPAVVTIIGTEKLGNTLSAELLDNQNNPCTTSAAVTYEWYRLNNQNDGFSNEIGTGKTYTLTDADARKYIGLSAELAGRSFTAISGQILANSTNNNSNNNTSNNSNGSSASSSGHHHSDATTDDETASANGSRSQAAQATSADGWVHELNGWEYFERGKPVTGWQMSNGEWYYLYSDGAMARDTSVDGYNIGDDGTWVQ